MTAYDINAELLNQYKATYRDYVRSLGNSLNQLHHVMPHNVFAELVVPLVMESLKVVNISST